MSAVLLELNLSMNARSRVTVNPHIAYPAPRAVDLFLSTVDLPLLTYSSERVPLCRRVAS